MDVPAFVAKAVLVELRHHRLRFALVPAVARPFFKAVEDATLRAFAKPVTAGFLVRPLALPLCLGILLLPLPSSLDLPVRAQ